MSLQRDGLDYVYIKKKTYENFAICWDELKGTVETIETDSIGKSGPLFNQQET